MSQKERKPSEIVAVAASSMAVNAAFTELLKGTVHEMRPDKSGDNSFPSRHTSWAFAASSVVSRELYRYSPWWSVGAQTLASAVGLQRIRARRHYGSDVVWGAAVGIASAEMCYWLTGRIFHRNSRPLSCYNNFRPGFAVMSEAVYTSDEEVCTGFGIVFRGQLPVAEHWGAVMSLRTSSAPVKNEGMMAEPFTTYGATAGVMGHFVLPVDCLALEPSAQFGAVRLQRTPGYCAGRTAFEADCDIALSWRLTGRFAVRGCIGYRFLTQPRCVSAFTVGLGSVAYF
ncbi:MAG: phosphatase PAP2 family protein [Muribaculaceae bacterium]|nr:phosphatase PAP2 family protein [Muribaculaceae bacterium]